MTALNPFDIRPAGGYDEENQMAAGEYHIGEVTSGHPVVVSATLATTAGAYTAGDAVGKATLSNVGRINGGYVQLENLYLIDVANQKAVLDIFIFDADPAASTFTEHAAGVIHADDIAKIVGIIHVAATDYNTVDSKGWGYVNLSQRLVKCAAAGKNLIIGVIAAATPTFGTSGLTIKVAAKGL